MSDLPPAGWYPTDRPGEVRWWDGAAWTDHRQPLQATPVYATAPAGYGYGYALPPSAANWGHDVETPGFIGAFKDGFRNYAKFDGRTSVGGFWRFVGMYWLVFVGLVMVSSVIVRQSAGAVVGLIWVAYIFGGFLPTLAATVRRLHDTGRSGAHYLVSFIPFVGGIIMIVWTAEAGYPGPNQYGLPPVADSGALPYAR